jgi:hypothetical protein
MEKFTSDYLANTMAAALFRWRFAASKDVGRLLIQLDIRMLEHKRDAAITCGRKCHVSHPDRRFETVGVSGMAPCVVSEMLPENGRCMGDSELVCWSASSPALDAGDPFGRRCTASVVIG